MNKLAIEYVIPSVSRSGLYPTTPENTAALTSRLADYGWSLADWETATSKKNFEKKYARYLHVRTKKWGQIVADTEGNVL